MSEETKKCPFCGEEILAMAIKCKHCQSMLNDISQIDKKITPAVAQPYPAKEPINISGLDYFKGVSGVILTSVVIFFTGWLYIWSCSIPFVFWLMPLVYGGVAGITMFFAVSNFRTDNIGVFIASEIFAGVIAYYANWVWFIHDIFADFIMSPEALWDRINIVQNMRQIDVDTFAGSRRGILAVKDGWLVLAWLIEFIMIMGGVASGIFYILTKESFFCSTCKHWNDAKSNPYKLASDKPEHELISFEAIMQMTTPADENSDHYTVTILECPHCKNGTFSLATQKAVLKDGKIEFKEKTLLNKISCPVDKVKELKKFVTATGIECKK